MVAFGSGFRGLRPGSIAVEVGVGEATAAGLVPEGIVEELVHRGYLSTSGVERIIARMYDYIERAARVERGGGSQPPIILFNAPPGVGKTYTMLRFLEAVRRRGEIMDVSVPFAVYMAPYKTILEDVREAYKRLVDGYDPAHGKVEPVYLLYRSPRDCRFARQWRDYIELWGSEEIACQLCPYRLRLNLMREPRRLYNIMRRVIVGEERGIDAPVVDVLPQAEGQTCLRNIAVQAALTLPRLKSRRRALIAGLIGSFNSILNPAYAKAWEELGGSDAVKLMIFDEFDMLITEPVVISTELPLDLYPSEKKVLHETITIRAYNEAVKTLESLVEDPGYIALDKAREAVEKLSVFTHNAVEEICRRCRRDVLENREYCRLCHPARTLSFISWFMRRSLEAGCHPLYTVLLLETRPECYNHALILSVQRAGDKLRIEARPVWWTIRLLLDPFYPSTMVKVLTSATADVLLVPPGGRRPFDTRLATISYGRAIMVNALARYDKLIVDLIVANDEVYKAIEDVRQYAWYYLKLDVIYNSGEGKEQRLLLQAPLPSCILLGHIVELLRRGDQALIFANSKRNARIIAELVNEYVSWKDEIPYISATADYYKVSWGRGEVYITWYRSRVSRGVSSFAPVKAAGVLLWQSDPPTENQELHHTYRQAASTVQSLFRIIRSLHPGLKYFVMFDVVWEYLTRRGPSWLAAAPASVRRLDISHRRELGSVDLCVANIEKFVEKVRKFYS